MHRAALHHELLQASEQRKHEHKQKSWFPVYVCNVSVSPSASRIWVQTHCVKEDEVNRVSALQPQTHVQRRKTPQPVLTDVNYVDNKTLWGTVDVLSIKGDWLIVKHLKLLCNPANSFWGLHFSVSHLRLMRQDETPPGTLLQTPSCYFLLFWLIVKHFSSNLLCPPSAPFLMLIFLFFSVFSFFFPFLHISIQWIVLWPKSTTDSLSVFPLPCSGALVFFLSFFSGVLRHSDPLPVPSSLRSSVYVNVCVRVEVKTNGFCFCSIFALHSSDPSSFAFSHTTHPPPTLFLPLPLSAWPNEASCLQVGVDRDLCHESLPGDPWHLGVPLLCMQGMLARCTPALMKGGTHSDADSRTLWKFDRQQGVDKEKQFQKMRSFPSVTSPSRGPENWQSGGFYEFFPPPFFSFLGVHSCTLDLWKHLQAHTELWPSDVLCH